jgi:Family of unknown function (DUF5683)
MFHKFAISVCLLCIATAAYTQNISVAKDTIMPIAKEQLLDNSDTTKQKLKKHNPRTATRRSAILPGWGQAYNKQYWKMPIVWGALAIPTATYIYNNTWYKRTSFAYEALYNATFFKDSSGLASIHPDLKRGDLRGLQNFRNGLRRDRDYSILWFFILWGINVVDATVFGHLKEFNVSKDLSMQVSPTYNPQIKSTGINLSFALRGTAKKASTNASR